MTSDYDNTRGLREAMGTFATGVTVVTTLDGDGWPCGFTANSYTSVSLDPPLVLVCLGRSAIGFDAFDHAASFAVNILAEDQQPLAVQFAQRSGDKFDGVRWSVRSTGSPVIDSAVAWLDCEMHEIVDGGDHAILIGRVVKYASSARAPLTYCRGAYGTFTAAPDDET